MSIINKIKFKSNNNFKYYLLQINYIILVKTLFQLKFQKSRFNNPKLFLFFYRCLLIIFYKWQLGSPHLHHINFAIAR